MEAACSSETLQNFYRTTRRYMPEGSIQYGYSYEKILIILCLKTSFEGASLDSDIWMCRYVILLKSLDSVFSMRWERICRTQAFSSVRLSTQNMTCPKEMLWIDFRRLSSVFSLTLDFRLNELQLRNSADDSELFYDWRFTVNQFVLAWSRLRLTARDFFFSTESLRS
jgi:hypothetical protein